MSNHIEPDELARLRRKMAAKAGGATTGAGPNSPTLDAQTAAKKTECAKEPANAEERTKLQVKRARVEEEFVQSETKYVGSLQLLMSLYIEPLKVKMSKNDIKLSAGEFAQLLQNISQIAEFHKTLAADLEHKCGESAVAASGTNPKHSVVNVFRTYVDFLRMYCTYVNGYEASIQTLTRLMKHNSAFAKFCRKQRDVGSAAPPLPAAASSPTAISGGASHPQQTQQLDLSSYLVMPVQRVPRYELLFREILRFTPASDKDYAALQLVMDKVKEINVSINEGKRQIENTQKICELRDKCQKLPETLELIEPHRRLIRTGQFVILTDAPLTDKVKKGKPVQHSAPLRKDCYFILFNDALLWLTLQYEFVGWTKLAESVADMYGRSTVGSQNAMQLLEICKDGSHCRSDSQFPLLLEAQSGEEAQSWCESLKEAKENVTQREHSRNRSVSQRN